MTRPLSSTLRSAATALTLAALATLAHLNGCASNSSQEAKHSSPQAQSSPADVLDPLIRRESRRPSKLAQQAPTPPRLANQHLEPISGDQPEALRRARLSSEEALAEVEAYFPEAPRLSELDIPEADRRRAVALFAEGRAHRLDGHQTHAIKILEQAARLDPDAAAPWREIGEAQLELGDRHAARIAFSRAFDRDPSDPRVLEQVAALAGSDVSDQQTAALLARLLRTRTNTGDPALKYLVPARLGNALLNLGYISAAIQLLEQAVDLPQRFGSPSTRGPELASLYRRRGDIWTTIGDAHLQLNQPLEALDAYERAAGYPSLDPAGLLQRRVHAAMRLGRPATAAALTLQHLADQSLRTDDASLATLRYISENSDIAQEIDEAIVAIESSLPESERRLAAAHLSRTRAVVLPRDRAIEVFYEHIANHPTDDVTLAGLFDLLAQSPQDALLQAIRLTHDAPLQNQRFVRALLRSIPDPTTLINEWDALDEPIRQSPEARLLRARLLVDANQPIAADAAYHSILRDFPNYAPAVIARVQLLRVLERTDEADRLLQSIDPTESPDLAYATAITLADRPETQPDAQAIIEDALQSIPTDHPRHIDLLILGARLAAEREDYPRAEQWFQAALEIDPTREEAHAELIQLYASQSPLANDQKLVDQLARLRDVNPSSRILRTIRAREALTRGQYDLAERSLLELTDQYPDDTTAIDTLVNLWLRTNAHERAETWLRRQSERFPARNIYQIKLAEVLVHQSQFKQAADTLKTWLEQYPGDVTVSILLESIYRQGLDDPRTANILALRRLRRSADQERSAAHQATLLVMLNDYKALTSTIETAVRHAAREDKNLTQWAASICGDLFKQVLEGKCQPSIALEATALICDSLDDLNEMCHGARLQLLGYSTSLDSRSARSALDRAVQQHPDKAHALYNALITAALLPEIRQDFDPKDRSQRPVRDATKAEITQRLDLAANLAIEGTTLPNTTPDFHTLFVYLQYAALNTAYTHDIINEFARANQVAQNVAGTPDKDRLIQGVFRALTRDPQRKPNTEQSAETAGFIAARLDATGNTSAADTYFDLALQYAPDSPFILNNYAYRLIERNDPALLDRATEMLVQAYAATQNPPANVIDSLGWARYKAGVIHSVLTKDGAIAVEGAVTLLSRALQRAEDNPQQTDFAEVAIVADHAGDALWLAGDRPRAIERWRRTITASQIIFANENLSRALGPSLLDELQTAANNARQKLEDALADRTPTLAPMFRPANTPNQIIQSTSSPEPPTPPAEPTPLDKVNAPENTGDPG